MAKRVLTRRERVLISAAATVFFAMIVLPLGSILSRKYRETQTALATAEQGLKDVRVTRRAVLEHRRGAELIAERVRAGSGDFVLFNFARSVVDQRGLTDRARLQERVAPAKLSLITVELNGISLEELIGLMSALQDGKHLIAMELLSTLEASRDKKGLNCSISLVAPRA